MRKSGVSTATSYRNSSYDQLQYDRHIQRLKSVNPVTDTKPGKVKVSSLVNSLKFTNIQGYSKIHHVNFKLIQKMNEIKYAFLMKMNEWAPRGLDAAAISTLSSPKARSRALNITRENRKFAERLEKIHRRNCAKESKKKTEALICEIGKFKLPEKILEKYENRVEIPENPCLQFKIFRPSIFIDLIAINERPIGRVSFQLYTEACPMIILELVKVFMRKQKERINFCRIFPNFWAECEVAIDGENFHLPGIEYDMRALDHASSLGIISVDVGEESQRCLRHGLLNLAFSFKPLPVLNGKRVAIGRITNGRRNLTGLSEYGTKGGKPLKNIVVTQMGIVGN